MARTPSVSTLLGSEPAPRPRSVTHALRLEEQQFYEDLEDDLDEDFEDDGAGKKVLVALVLLTLLGAGVVSLVPTVNEAVFAATGVRVPSLMARSSDTGETAQVQSPAAASSGAAAESGTTGAPAVADSAAAQARARAMRRGETAGAAAGGTRVESPAETLAGAKLRPKRSRRSRR